MKKNRVTMLSFLLLFIALAFSTMASLVSAQQSQPVTTHVVPGLRIPLNYIRAGGVAQAGARGPLHCVFSFGSISKPETGTLPIEQVVYVPVTEFSYQPYRLRAFQDVLGDLSDLALQEFLCGDPDEILHLSLEHESGEQIEPRISTAEYNETLDAEIVFIGLPDEAFIRQGVWYLYINESVVIFDIAITTPSIYQSWTSFEIVGGFQPYEQIAMLAVCTSEAATLEGFSNRVSRDRNGFVVTDYVFVETLELVEVVEVLEANELGALFFENGFFGSKPPSCQPDSFVYYVLVGNQGSVLNGTLFTEDNKLMRDELYELVWGSADGGDTAGGTQNPMTINDLRDEEIRMFWINFDCGAILYVTIGAHSSHPRKLPMTGMTGRCLAATEITSFRLLPPPAPRRSMSPSGM